MEQSKEQYVLSHLDGLMEWERMSTLTLALNQVSFISLNSALLGQESNQSLTYASICVNQGSWSSFGSGLLFK